MLRKCKLRKLPLCLHVLAEASRLKTSLQPRFEPDVLNAASPLVFTFCHFVSELLLFCGCFHLFYWVSLVHLFALFVSVVSTFWSLVVSLVVTFCHLYSICFTVTVCRILSLALLLCHSCSLVVFRGFVLCLLSLFCHSVFRCVHMLPLAVSLLLTCCPSLCSIVFTMYLSVFFVPCCCELFHLTVL